MRSRLSAVALAGAIALLLIGSSLGVVGGFGASASARAAPHAGSEVTPHTGARTLGCSLFNPGGCIPPLPPASELAQACINGALTGGVAGCIGGAGEAAALYWQGLQAGETNLYRQETAWDLANLGWMGYGFNQTIAGYETQLSILNGTQDYLGQAADAAAKLQLGNASFNPLEDISQSLVGPQLAGIETAAVAQYGITLHVFNGAWNANYGPNGYWEQSGRTPANKLINYPIGQTGGCVGYDGCAFNTESAYYTPTVNTGSSIPIEVLAGANLTQTTGTGCSGFTLTSIDGADLTPGGKTASTSITYAGNGPYNYSGPTDAVEYSPTAGTTCILGGQGLQMVYQSTNDNEGAYGAFGVASSVEVPPSGASPAALYTATVNPNYPIFMEHVSNSAQFTPGYQVLALAANSTRTAGPQITSFAWAETEYRLLETNAEASAFAYWTFLRDQGFTSASQIPAQCVIPTPSTAIPANFYQNLYSRGLNESQVMLIYIAYMNGLAHTFDYNWTATNYCLPHKPSVLWLGNLTASFSDYVVGDIYVPNATLYPSEKLSTPSTWAYNNATVPQNVTNGSLTFVKESLQILLIPAFGNIKVPMSTVWEIPANVPMTAILPETGEYLQLAGNGTDVPIAGQAWCSGPSSTACKYTTARPFAAAPGDALYVTSCYVNGSSTTNCVIQTVGIHGYVGNGSCGSGSTNTTACAAGGGGGGGLVFGNPFAGLASWFCGLPLVGALCGGSAGLLTLALEALFILVVVIVVIALVAYGFRSALGAGKKKEGGGGGPPSS